MDKDTKAFIQSQSWPEWLKNRAMMIAQARVERQLPAMSTAEWELWALNNGGSKA